MAQKEHGTQLSLFHCRCEFKHCVQHGPICASSWLKKQKYFILSRSNCATKDVNRFGLNYDIVQSKMQFALDNEDSYSRLPSLS